MNWNLRKRVRSRAQWVADAPVNYGSFARNSTFTIAKQRSGKFTWAMCTAADKTFPSYRYDPDVAYDTVDAAKAAADSFARRGFKWVLGEWRPN